MTKINVTIRVSMPGSIVPLKRVFVEHIALGIRVPFSPLYITDDLGRVIDEDGNLGIESILGGPIDIRVLCHNSIVRIPNLIIDHHRDFTVADGSLVTITARNSTEIINHYRILQRCIDIYDNSLRQFRVFRSEFPLGRKKSLNGTRLSRKRIEIVFPDFLPQPLSFVNPVGISTGYPVIHIKNDDDRLFGTRGAQPMLIPAELAHALHFSFLSRQQRLNLASQYASFIVSDSVRGGTGGHNMLQDTDPLVAFVEAFDHFLHRFDRFTRTNPSLEGVELRNGFIEEELNSSEDFSDITGSVTSRGFGVLTGNLRTGSFMPNIEFLTTGSRSATSIEGSVYAAIFLDFARKPHIGLLNAVTSYIRSKALSFGSYREWIINRHPEWRAQIDEVKNTWTL